MPKNKSNMKMKRGQVTIFVVLGLVLIAAIAGVLYIVKNQERPRVDVPDDLVFEHNNIKKFVESCTYSIAKEAIIKLGEQGGYIDPLATGVTFVPGFPTKGRGFEFVEGSEFVIPYWYHMSSPDSCVYGCDFASEQPQLLGSSSFSVESQISDYIELQLNDCLRDFSDFDYSGLDITQPDVFVANTIIGRDKVTIKLDNDILLGKDGETTTISEFSTDLDVKLGDMFIVGSELVYFAADNNTKLLEALTKETIALGSIGNDPALPPMRGAAKINLFDLDYWLLTEVESEIELLLMTYVPSLQVLFAKNSAVFDTSDEYIDATYNNRIIMLNHTRVNPAILNELNVNFIYLGWWDSYVKVKPGGQMITPNFNGWKNKFFSLGIYTYDFGYDVSYPVMVIIEDEDAFNGEGFILQFGLEANLRNNQPVIGNIPYGLEEESEYVSIIDFCDLQQRNSGNIKINVIDELNGNSLDDVDVSFDCIDETCLLGKTQNGIGINTKLPICWGGYLTASKMGYPDVIVPLSTNLDVDDEVSISLIKEKTYDVSIKKHVLRKFGFNWELSNSYSVLDDSEQLFLLIQKVVETDESEYIKFVSIEGIESATINLVPGEYTVEATLIRNLGPGMDPEEIVIAEQEMYGETIPEIVFNSSFLEGGLTFDINHTWTVTSDNYNKDKIIFHVVGLDVNSINSYDDLEQMEAYVEYSESERTLLEPEFE